MPRLKHEHDERSATDSAWAHAHSASYHLRSSIECDYQPLARSYGRLALQHSNAAHRLLSDEATTRRLEG